jgi:glycosyltransferase involved in cell wall biosynthesis
MKVALAHDWLTGMRGGEKVLEALGELFPAAEILTLVHVRGSVSPAIEAHRIRTSAVGRLPGAARRYRHYLPLFPAAIEQFDLDHVDLVVSSSHCAAKAIVRPGRARHLCYCHSPMRYAWDQFDEYFGPALVGRVRSRLYRHALARLARWDAATAGRVDGFVANSRHVAGRIRRYYNREAIVVYPPVDTEFFHPDASAPGSSFLVVSALVPYKRIDVAIEACRRVGAPLTIVGEGPERSRLERLAGPDVTFLGRRSNEDVRALYRAARAVLLPGEEDFGVVPVEAQACGRPVVARARGGACESVEDGVSGVLVDAPGPGAFADGLARVTTLDTDPRELRGRVLRFSRDRFKREMAGAIDRLMRQPREAGGW